MTLAVPGQVNHTVTGSVNVGERVGLQCNIKDYRWCVVPCVTVSIVVCTCCLGTANMIHQMPSDKDVAIVLWSVFTRPATV